MSVICFVIKVLVETERVMSELDALWVGGQIKIC